MDVPLLVVVGPTASGKTALALRIAEAVGGEIVSADSVQVYRHFDVGTGKPTSEELARAPHHLVDCREPDEPLDAAGWAGFAATAITEIDARGRRPIVCGGTFLWVKALLYGLAPAPPGDPVLRARHAARAAEQGRPVLHDELRRVDPELALKLAPNDLVRVSRGLEVFELTGVPLSEWQRQHGFRSPRYDARLVGIGWEKDRLRERIGARVAAMLDAGWIEEVRALLDAGYGDTRPMGCVGYRQLAERLRTEAPLDVPVLSDEITRATHVFARRQRTWLRDQPAHWLEPAAAEAEPVATLLSAVERPLTSA